MKAEFEAERGIQASHKPVMKELLRQTSLEKVSGGSTRDDGQPVLHFDRGVANYPLPQQTLYLTPQI